MSKKEFYQKLYNFLIKYSILFFIIIVCFIFFFLAKKTKEPKTTISLMDILKDVELESCLFDALDESFVPKEEIKELKQNFSFEDQDFLYFKILTKYPILIDTFDSLPLELWVYKDKELIPYKEEYSNVKDKLSWYFNLEEKRKILYIDARDMNIMKDAQYILKEEDGMLVAQPGYIYSVVELPSGLKEIKINAGGKCVIPPEKKVRDFDYSAGMQVSIDNKVLGEVFAEEGKITPFIFRKYLPSGWHKIEIAFTNDIWVPEKGLDRNLLVKDLEIYNILGAIYFKIRKEFAENFILKNYSLSYFRALDDDDKNNLIIFYKKRFNIDNLKDIVITGSGLKHLIKDVEIDRLIKRAIFAPAPTKIKARFKVPVDGIRLVFSFAVMPEAWDKTGDGVEFKVKLVTEAADTEEVLFSKYINPKANPEDRKWFEGEIDLRRFKAKEVVLIFETNGSVVSPITPTEDFSYDWAVWGG